MLEQFDVIAMGLRRFVKGVVGHHQGAGKVISERDAGEGPAVLIGEVTFIDEHVDLALGGQQADLVGGLKIAAVRPETVRQAQNACLGIVTADRAIFVLREVGNAHARKCWRETSSWRAMVSSPESAES